MKILVTGKSGVGKTTILKKIDYTNIFFVDDFVKNILYKKGHKVYDFLISNFFYSDKKQPEFIDTKELGKILFNDHEKLENVSQYVSPYLQE